MSDFEKARSLLFAENYTCVLCLGDRILTSRKRGVAPVLELVESGEVLKGFCAADKVVGKATALLYRLLGVKAVYADVISDSALQTLHDGGITVVFLECVPYIINRTGDGRCPMEIATADIDEPALAPAAIRKKLEELRKA